MITPVPARVDDPKTAALWMALHSMEQIDSNLSSRATFAQSILFNIAMSLDNPVFKDEIRELRQVLGVKEEEPVVEETLVPALLPEGVGRDELYLREL